MDSETKEKFQKRKCAYFSFTKRDRRGSHFGHIHFINNREKNEIFLRIGTVLFKGGELWGQVSTNSNHF